MYSAVLDFPIKHIDKNLVFGQDGTVTAYFKIGGFNYDFLDHEDKFMPFSLQQAFLFNNRYDLHYISEPFPTNIDEIIDHTIEEMKLKEYPLKESGLLYMEQLKQILIEHRANSETSEYFQYIGVQLNPEKNKYLDMNVGLQTLNTIKELWKGLNTPVHKALGLQVNDMLKSEIDAWHDQSDMIQSSLIAAFNCKVSKISTVECIYIIEKEFSVTPSNIDIDHRRGFKSSEKVNTNEGEEAVRPKPSAFLDIQNTNIEEVTPTTLRFSKILENEEGPTDMYSRYLVVHSMESENFFPNFEWMYHLQSTMPFPISISVRAYHQSNERIIKRLSNKRLEYQDQRAEAYKSGSNTDLALDDSERGAIQAEAYFQKTGQPAYSCSFVFKVTASNTKDLEIRTKRLKDELLKYGIKAVAPYGEQLNLMMEKVLGARQINEDYKIEVESGVLAGMMFGGTTSVGDNRGFFIGFTDRLNRPVFVQPDLAAKAFEGLGNLEDSISLVVAGATGKGKSFFMNLYLYLSLLTGSQALVIDPKGDRKGWDSLPLIDSEHISKWTLGTNKEDDGCLDPFRTSVDIEEGKNVALDILSYLTNVDINDMEYTLLSEAIEFVGENEDPCIGGIIDYLVAMFNKAIKGETKISDNRFKALESLKDALVSLNSQKISSLLFGKVGQNYKVLKVDKPLQVLMVENLNLPEKGTEKIRPVQKISEAILISITAFTKQYMFKQDRSIHKIILQDEASSIDRSATGRELMDFIVRKGRYYNTTLMKGSQNASDHGDDVANMGMKFSFGLKTTKESKQMLEFLNLPVTDGNVDRIRTMERGHCLFQDIYGRTALIRVDPIFSNLAQAFDSSTATEVERERERQRNGQEDEVNNDL
ncbi:ATP-binding protein [Viridibacillus sp. NPDC093762]|uniref:ATP-binding protein n=1 Tax=Viridibacillus sp. NPDC093762 TaxID=3390720 RepID=UPI003D001DE8